MKDEAGGGLIVDTNGPAGTAMECSSLYGFLAAVYRTEPTAELLRWIRDPDSLDLLADTGVDLGTFFADHAEDELIELLAVEYTRLFIGPGNHVPPYAAVHLGGEGALLWGRPTVWVKKYIEAAGFEYRPDYHDLPDHISAELEFMREITAREAAALEKRDPAEAGQLRAVGSEFVASHLSLWIPKFCDLVIDRAELPFYRGMAALTKDFIESERANTVDGRESENLERREI